MLTSPFLNKKIKNAVTPAMIQGIVFMSGYNFSNNYINFFRFFDKTCQRKCSFKTNYAMISKTIINALFLLCLVCIVSTSSAQNYDDRCFIVQFSNGTTQAETDALLTQYNLYIEDGPTTSLNTKFVLVCVDSVLGWPESVTYNNGDEDINAVIEDVTATDSENDDILDALGLNYDIDLLSLPNESSPSFYHHPLENCGLNSFSIDTSPGNNKAKVGLLDTGIRPGGHTELNDFLDPSDIGWDIINDTPFPLDDNGHGTHMASSVTLSTPTNLSSVLSLQAFKTHDINGFASVWNLIKGIDKAVLAEVQIINMSNSYIAPYDHRFSNAPLLAAIEEANDIAGILFVAAAGNDGADNDNPNKPSNYPASFLADNIIAVTAIDCNHSIPSWANTGATSVDIAAPGVDIWGLDHNQQFVEKSGTSSAAAFVTRVAAMLATQQANFDYEKVKCAIINGAKELPVGSNISVSNGYLDATKAQIVFDTGSPCTATSPSPNLVPTTLGTGIVEASIQNGAFLNITSEKEQPARLSIFNTLGQVLYAKEIIIQEGQNKYTLEGFPQQTSSSVYICNLQYGTESETIKFVR